MSLRVGDSTRKLIVLPALILATGLTFAQTIEELPFEVLRLSERALVLTGVPLVGQVTALTTRRGIVVIDTGISWGIGDEIRGVIEREIGRKDFSFVINTHCHRDHMYGNQSYGGAIFVAHKNCRDATRSAGEQWGERLAGYVSLHRERVNRFTVELENLESESDEAERTRLLIAVNQRVADDLSQGQKWVPPTLSFLDRMTLDAGDMTFNLLYFGEAHTDSDILIEIPEERLLIVGDTFSKGSLGSNISSDRVDVKRNLEILTFLIGGDSDIERIVCGHGSIMTREELMVRFDYMRELWNGTIASRAEGLDIEATSKRLSLEKFTKVTDLMDAELVELKRQHENYLKKYWSRVEPK